MYIQTSGEHIQCNTERECKIVERRLRRQRYSLLINAGFSYFCHVDRRDTGTRGGGRDQGGRRGNGGRAIPGAPRSDGDVRDARLPRQRPTICRVLARPRMLPAFHLLPRLPNPARPAAEYDARAFGHRLNCTAQAPDKTSVTKFQ